MVKVCAHYCGTTILLGEFDEVKARDFMKKDCILAHEDETENGEEDIIYTDEMFIDDDEIPFCEPLDYEIDNDELPF